MLQELRIENFAIVDRLELTFGPGLNIFTGETGAGKSIIVDALELLLGSRASLDQIRTGSDQAVIEAAVHLPKGNGLFERLLEQGLIDRGEDELILRRVIARSGKGRILVNGHLVNLPTLQEIGRGWVDIHGQHEHQSLLYPENQLDLLDAYDRILPLRGEYKAIFRQWKSLKEQIEALQRHQQDKVRRQEYLQYQVQEIESAQLKPGEDTELEQERQVLVHSQKLSLHAQAAYQVLYETEASAFSILSEVEHHLKEIEAIDPRLTQTLKVWESAQAQLKEVAEQLRHYKDEIPHDPQRLQELEERLYLIGKLKKKYGATVEEILNHGASLSQELSLLEHQEERLTALQEEFGKQRKEVYDRVARLSQRRAQAARRLELDLEKEFKPLGLQEARFRVHLENAASVLSPEEEEAHLSERGADRVTFLVATNPGEDPKPLSRVASGGELSRMMLSFKTVLAEADRIPVLVFDEVDAGIGGAVAEAVGRRLKSIAKTRQVFCITHLPQIAMLADAHYCVQKSQTRGRTVTRVKRLDDGERVQEIARMLGGQEITPTTLRHAKEMLLRSGA